MSPSTAEYKELVDVLAAAKLWSYWLGMVSAVMALMLRAFNAFGIWLPASFAQGRTVWYMSFYKGALLFFVIAIATANQIWSLRSKPLC